jgi:hypothetical protein
MVQLTLSGLAVEEKPSLRCNRTAKRRAASAAEPQKRTRLCDDAAAAGMPAEDGASSPADGSEEPLSVQSTAAGDHSTATSEVAASPASMHSEIPPGQPTREGCSDTLIEDTLKGIEAFNASYQEEQTNPPRTPAEETVHREDSKLEAAFAKSIEDGTFDRGAVGQRFQKAHKAGTTKHKKYNEDRSMAGKQAFRLAWAATELSQIRESKEHKRSWQTVSEEWGEYVPFAILVEVGTTTRSAP